jgi:alpha-tubulin suppressor-like RCC1 family protein
MAARFAFRALLVLALASCGRETTAVRAPVEAQPGPSAAPRAGAVAEIAVGADWTCARYEDAKVACWGDDGDGQLGDGGHQGGPRPRFVVGIDDAVSIAVGLYASCAVMRGGTVACWGRGDNGELGDGRASVSATPQLVVGVQDATSVFAGSNHACAVRRDGTVVCWGQDLSGQVSATGHEMRQPPTVVPGISGARQLALGLDASCALLNDAGHLLGTQQPRSGQCLRPARRASSLLRGRVARGSRHIGKPLVGVRSARDTPRRLLGARAVDAARGRG